jgi:hypothetical protein
MSWGNNNLSDNNAGRYSIAWSDAVCFAAALMLIMPMYADSAAAAVPVGMDVEIPLSELNKVKKEAPPKKTAGKPKTNKKSDGKSQGTVTDATTAPKITDQSKKSGNEAINASNGDKALGNPPANPASEPENLKISHDPYSFVVAGKSTLIHAVIYRDAEELKSVTCRIRTTNKGEPTTVTMQKTNDSRFTYTATLPGLSPEMSSLSYAIVVVDSAGKESVSQEFVTPVKSSPLVPSWQN